MNTIQGNLSKFSAILWLLLGTLVALVLTFALYVRAEKGIDSANDRRQQSILLADELRHSSDDLSNMVRSYVVTGNPLYKAHYLEILDIRDGRSPRPLDYQEVYWDLVLQDDVRPRPPGAAVALIESMRQSGFSKEEFDRLSVAKANSDDLTRIELAAMALVESNRTQADQAVQMLYGDAYHQAKAAIMRPIGEFSMLADQRTAAEVRHAKAYARQMRYLLSAVILLQLFLLWAARKQLYAILGSSVEGLHRHIERLSGGDFTTAIQVPAGSEGSMLGWIAGIRLRLGSLDLTRFKSIVNSTDDAVITRSMDGRVTSWNPSAESMFGYTAAEMLGQPMQALIPDGNEAEDARNLARVTAGERIAHFETVFRCKSAKLVEISATISPIVDDAGTVIGISTIARDITLRKRSESDLAESEIRYRAAFMTSPDAINITRVADGLYLEVSDGFERMTGWRRDEVIGKTSTQLGLWADGADRTRFMDALRRDGYYENLEAHFIGKDGRRIVGLMSAHKMMVKGELCLLSVTRDITERKVAEEQLKRAAHYDALTNLPNRVLLADRMKQAMTHALRRHQSVAVAYLDLDGFKEINDQHGHQTGDQLLISVANSMKQALREGDTLARLGGDEFVAVLLDLDNTGASVAMFNRILAAAALPVRLGALSLQVSASVGVTFFPQAQELDADQLLRQADQAMYQAKLSGKNRCQIFDATQDSNLRVHHESLERIRLALKRREFILHYQPKVNMRTGELVGVEALIRWQHPEQGLLAPAAFLPVIENHALAVEVGEWVMDEALTQHARWHASGQDIPISVNVGARQLQQPDFLQRLQAILARHPGIHPSRLELEILETSALEDVTQVSELIDACARIGVGFALDDFGTGYSSLTYLKRLKVELLKIDQSFVRDMLDDADDLAILEGVIGLASAFGRKVIAEGVETAAHGRLLLDLGCELAQGYGIARPMAAADLPQWMSGWTPDPSWAKLPWLGSGE